MNTNAISRLNNTGPEGQELFLAVDFSGNRALVLSVDPRNGKVRITDAQSLLSEPRSFEDE